jgi:cytochrome c-type biogenesis protein CcmH/NrfG
MDAAIAAKDKSQTSDNAWMTIADIHLQMGQRTEALSALGRAVALNPANKQQLLHNADFEALYKDPEFIKLVGSN